MKIIKYLAIFTGKDVFSIDLSNYDEIRDETMEFPDHSEFVITCYKGGKAVRRFINPSCDVTYKEQES